MVLATYAVAGHSDGMRVNPTTHKVWVSSNEDADARLFEIDPTVADASAAVTEYTVTGLTHGGGTDDLQFVNGNFYVACSNPANPGTLVPAVGTFTIANSTAIFNPIFYDDSSAVPVGSDAAATPLHLTDPDRADPARGHGLEHRDDGAASPRRRHRQHHPFDQDHLHAGDRVHRDPGRLDHSGRSGHVGSDDGDVSAQGYRIGFRKPTGLLYLP